MPEREPGEQVERDRGEAEAAAEPAEHAEREAAARRPRSAGWCVVVHAGSAAGVAGGQDGGDSVEALAGPDDDDHVAGLEDERRPGRDDAPRGRAARPRSRRRSACGSRVSPSLRPTNGDPAGIAICSVSSPAACSRRPASWPEHQRCAEHVGERLRLVVGERDGGEAGVGVVHVIEHEVASAVAVRDDADGAAGGGHQVVTDADARQGSLFHPYAHAANGNRRPDESLAGSGR